MTILNFQLENQLLTLTNQEIVASGDHETDKCVFNFSSEWDGYTKTGVFYQDKNNVQYVVLNSDDTCYIPSAAMTREGNLTIGVFGILGNKIITSTLVKQYIEEGAVEGGNVSTEPTDDVFIAIISQYQRIADLVSQYDETARQFNINMDQQNSILENLNAFEVQEIMQKLSDVESMMENFNNQAKQLLEREIVLFDVPINFTDKKCIIENEMVTGISVVDLYFDAMSYELASTSLIVPTSYDGYIEITSSEDISEELTANILIRRY